MEDNVEQKEDKDVEVTEENEDVEVTEENEDVGVTEKYEVVAIERVSSPFLFTWKVIIQYVGIS